MLADGGEAIADLAVLRNQSDLFGAVASDATAWRVLDGIDTARTIMGRFHTPIVFISGKTDPDLGTRVAALRGPELLDKPATANRLIPAIRRACNLTD